MCFGIILIELSAKLSKFTFDNPKNDIACSSLKLRKGGIKFDGEINLRNSVVSRLFRPGGAY